MDLFPEIYRRRSVRSYSDTQISPDKLAKVKKFIGSTEPLYSNIDWKYQLLNAEELHSQVSSIWKVIRTISAKNYILVTSAKKESYLVNIGFLFEYLVLYLTRQNIGTCWVGRHKMENFNAFIPEQKEQNPIILIAFGDPDKEDIEKRTHFNRKAISEIIINYSENIDERLLKIVDAARVAPSALNSQPWRFVVEKERIDCFIDKSLVLKISGNKQLNRIDAGIALSHLKVAAEHFSEEVDFQKQSGIGQRNLEYITSLYFT